MNEIVTVTIILLLLVVSPGPNIALILRTVSSKGRSAGIYNAFGFVIAAFFHGAFSILGLSTVILQSALLFFAVKIIGAMYLLYIGLKAIYESFSNSKSKIDLSNANSKVKTSRLQCIGDGLFTQLLNPKTSMFYLAAFPQFIDFQSQAYFEAFAFVSVHAFLMLVWYIGVCVFISNIKKLSSDSSLGQWVQRVSGGVLVVFSFMLLTQEGKVRLSPTA